jgi:(1->4)-alpha-D-glucan 1-alpha-D-glucosylmutase
VKLYLTHQALQLRQARPELFRDGSYEPLAVEGEQADHVVAFAREHGESRLIVAAPRLLSRLVSLPDLPLGEQVWGETWLRLTQQENGARYRNAFTGEELRVVELDSGVSLRLADAFGSFSYAALERIDG